MTSTRRARVLRSSTGRPRIRIFWSDQQRAQRPMQERTALEDQLTSIGRIEQELDDQITMIELGEAEEDHKTIADAQAALERLRAEVARHESEALLSGEADINDGYLEVHAGAGGTESQDWANMLLRMYTRWAEQHGYKIEYLERPEGEEAGIKSATVKVKGRNAYGWLKTENGVHRLVRISPFILNARRHTSFASVNVYPVIDDRIQVDVKEADVRVDTLRASGAGGQHVNKTEFGDPPHPYPNQYRGLLPERPFPASQSRPGMADVAGEAL